MNTEYGISKNLSNGINHVKINFPENTPEREKSLTHDAVICLSFMIKRGFTSFSDLIKTIKSMFNLDEDARMRETVRVLDAMATA